MTTPGGVGRRRGGSGPPDAAATIEESCGPLAFCLRLACSRRFLLRCASSERDVQRRCGMSLAILSTSP
ncbi:MAG: hypothetical protein MZU95_03905 [Desulfomicrobium escambiense]|nr:hypothetical protein [Desulfomicrobium escambiense]